MNLPKTFTRAATLVLCASVFAGTALAGDKPADGAPGNSGNAPGQEKKAEQAPQPAPAASAAAPATPPGQAKKSVAKPAKAERPAKPAKAAKAAKPQKPAKAAKAAKPGKPAKAAKPAKPAGSGSYKATSSGDDLKNDLDHKHTICHATGSATNPYVVITPSISGVHNGHLGHQGGEDIVPPYTYKGQTYSQNWDAAGQALFANGCRPAAAAQAQTTTAATTTTGTTTTTADCPGTTRTVTEVTRGGVFHKTGNGYVFIQPSPSSAHYDASKHPDDIVVPDQTVTRTVQVPGDCSAAATTTGATTTVTLQGETVTLAATTATVAGSTVTIPGQTVTVGGEARVETTPAATTTEAGGVLGAQSPPGAGREGAGRPDAGGVLGAVASLGQTATSGTLPFTGIPLWVATLVGGGLLFAGFALRRAA